MTLAGVLVVAAAARALWSRHREARYGSLVSVDSGHDGPVLRSERYGLVGRPDELRRRRDGRLVPVEFKSRAAPPRGPPTSHRVQVWAYCLLVEESTGARPPYGVLRYGDGVEFEVPWDEATRAVLLRWRVEAGRPYDGRASPSVAKCTGCRWREVCDASAA